MIDFDRLQDWQAFVGDDDEDTRLCRDLFSRAESYLSSFKWCTRVLERYVGFCVGRIIAVVLFKIEPLDADEWIWVVVGDIPSAYITLEGNRRASDALRGYVAEMRRWVAVARAHGDVSGLIPVNLPATPTNAAELERRLDYLEREILPEQE